MARDPGTIPGHLHELTIHVIVLCLQFIKLLRVKEGDMKALVRGGGRAFGLFRGGE